MFAGSVIAAPRSQPTAHTAPAASGPREWKGSNGWEVGYAAMGGGTYSCVMVWSNQSNATLLWVWDATMLQVGFMGVADGMGVGLKQIAEPRVTVDGQLLFKQMMTFGVVMDLPSRGRTLMIEPVFVSWDANNPGHDTGPETGTIFERLRSGHVLSVTIAGQTYQENLTGVGSALDLFPKCLNYAAGQQQ